MRAVDGDKIISEINYKRFWEELIVYVPFTVTLVSDTSRKKTIVCMRNEVNKTI
jgi:hypothetical protein